MKKTLKAICFWVLSCTWGILMTAIGLLASLGLLIAGKKPRKFAYSFYFEVGKDWGGIALGPVLIMARDAERSRKQHEFGHALQNSWFGPIMPFLINIPSMIRYWFRKICITKTQTERYRYVARALGTLLGLSIILVIVCAFTKITTIGLIGFIVGIFVSIYCFALLTWMFEFEIPKYEILIPDYTSIWFERVATNVAAKF